MERIFGFNAGKRRSSRRCRSLRDVEEVVNVVEVVEVDVPFRSQSRRSPRRASGSRCSDLGRRWRSARVPDLHSAHEGGQRKADTEGLMASRYLSEKNLAARHESVWLLRSHAHGELGTVTDTTTQWQHKPLAGICSSMWRAAAKLLMRSLGDSQNKETWMQRCCAPSTQSRATGGRLAGIGRRRPTPGR